MCRMAAETLRVFGRIDILVASAGTLRGASALPRQLAELGASTWDEITGTNLKGVFLSNRAVLPPMIRQRGGTIINLSSTSGRTGLAFDSAYCASKFGVIGLSQAVAAEVRQFGIRVHALLPGPVATPMWQQNGPIPYFGAAIPPERVADAIRHVASAARGRPARAGDHHTSAGPGRCGGPAMEVSEQEADARTFNFIPQRSDDDLRQADGPGGRRHRWQQRHRQGGLRVLRRGRRRRGDRRRQPGPDGGNGRSAPAGLRDRSARARPRRRERAGHGGDGAPGARAVRADRRADRVRRNPAGQGQPAQARHGGDRPGVGRGSRHEPEGGVPEQPGGASGDDQSALRETSSTCPPPRPFQGRAHDGPYCASKFGVIGLSQAVAEEVRHSGVRVEVGCPTRWTPRSGSRTDRSGPSRPWLRSGSRS